MKNEVTERITMKVIAEFDKPYDALLIMLKDELQANSIDYQVSGEKGHDVQYLALTFDIKVLVDDTNFDTAVRILKKLKSDM